MSMDAGQEAEIILRVQKGDRNAYARLVDAHKGQVFNLAYRLIGSYQEAEDVSQETFLRAYGAIHRFSTAKRFYPWLYAIGLNVIRNHLKRRAKESAPANPPALQSRRSPETSLVEAQRRERLHQCLRRLELSLREAVTLRFYQDLSFRDLSEILGISQSAAKMRVYRGLDKLKVLMAASEGSASCPGDSQDM
jgi:RNA polymerase sigma-70 factor (ECF subfamily)